jgi:hypothetical protein
MKSLPFEVSFAHLGNLPSTIRRVAIQSLTAGLALLLTCCLLAPAATLRAQTEPSPEAGQEGVRDVQPDVSAETSEPIFVLASTKIQAPAEHSTATGVIVTTSKNGYAGTVHYTCALTTKTETATPPLCAMYPAQETLSEGGNAQPLMLIFGKGTHLPDGITEGKNSAGGSLRWLGTGGAVLASCLIFGIPARRRRWRSILPVLLLLIEAGGFAGCGDVPQIMTAGQYLFKVTATDSKDANITTSVTIPVRVL